MLQSYFYHLYAVDCYLWLVLPLAGGVSVETLNVTACALQIAISTVLGTQSAHHQLCCTFGLMIPAGFLVAPELGIMPYSMFDVQSGLEQFVTGV